MKEAIRQRQQARLHFEYLSTKCLRARCSQSEASFCAQLPHMCASPLIQPNQDLTKHWRQRGNVHFEVCLSKRDLVLPLLQPESCKVVCHNTSSTAATATTHTTHNHSRIPCTLDAILRHTREQPKTTFLLPTPFRYPTFSTRTCIGNGREWLRCSNLPMEINTPTAQHLQ